MSNPVFRQKSIEKISSPEQMNDYIRVSNPSVWIILAAVIVLLAGVFVWGLFGRLDSAFQTGGVCKDGSLTVYVSEENFAKISEKAVISVDGAELALSDIPSSPVRLDDKGERMTYRYFIGNDLDCFRKYCEADDILARVRELIRENESQFEV